MIKTDVETIKQQLITTNENTFLYIGGHHFLRAGNKDAKTIAKEIDFSITCFWIWEDTEFDEENPVLNHEAYLQGPLLIQLHNIGKLSPLIGRFIEKWACEQKGIILTSPYTGEELAEHLKSLLWMQGESQVEERYTMSLQNPDYQTAWLKSFSAQKLEQFMGPISTMSYLEVCGYDLQWYSQRNENPSYKLQNVGWYVFDKNQITEYKKQEKITLEKEIISYISHYYPDRKQQEIKERAKLTITQAQQKGIKDYKSTVLMLKAQLYLSRNKEQQETTINLLTNNEMPLDIRVELAEQKLNQVQQA